MRTPLKLRHASSFLLACSFGCSTSASTLDIDVVPGPPSKRLRPRPLGTTNAPAGYYEYVPETYGSEPLPLLVFFHGLGENGDGDADLFKVTRHGPPKLILADEWPNDRPFVVVAPQQEGRDCPGGNRVKEVLEFAVSTYDVDPNRVYVTGLSCGAIGTWNYLETTPEPTPAAYVLIAGDGRSAVAERGCQLAPFPIWAFHGTADRVVPPEGSTMPIASLQACNGVEPETTVTLYPGVGHDSWTQTYDGNAGHDVYAWMLSFRRL